MNNKVELYRPFDESKSFLLREYDEFDNDDLDGSADKQFYLADSDSFEAIFDHKKNKSYVTYIDALILCGDKLEQISVMKKKSYDYSVIYNETVCSRLLNYFDIPTVYNDVACEVFPDKQAAYSTLSVDFMKAGDKYYSLAEAGYKKLNPYSSLSDWLQILDRVVDDYAFKAPANKYLIQKEAIEQNREEIKKDFVNMFLYKKVFLNDADFYNRNIGIIENADGIHLAPAFDMEHTLTSRGDNDLKLRELQDCYALYPQLTDNFVKNINKLVNQSDLDTILTESIANPIFARDIGNTIEYYVNNIDMLYMDVNPSIVEEELMN